MKEGITKQEFIKSLENTLKLTRAGDSIDRLELEGACQNYVLVVFKDGYRKFVDINCDSGIAIITDVVKRLY